MEKGIKIGGIALFVLYGIYPLGALIARIGGYQLTMFNGVVWNLLLIALTAAYFVLRLKTQDPFDESEDEDGIPIGLLPVVGMANWVSNATKGTGIIATALLAFFCTFILGMKFAKIKWAKTTGLLVSGALLMPMAFLSVIGISFGNGGNDTVVDTVFSPEKTCYVEVIDNNQGEQGGNVVVKAYQDGGFDAGIFAVSKRPVTVYVAKYEKTVPTVNVGWDGEETVLINEKAYSVSETYTEVE